MLEGRFVEVRSSTAVGEIISKRIRNSEFSNAPRRRLRVGVGVDEQRAGAERHTEFLNEIVTTYVWSEGLLDLSSISIIAANRITVDNDTKIP